jgi:hypothetical protein
MDADIHVEVCYALPDQQYVFNVTVPAGSTLGDAIRRSGILDECPHINLQQNRVGVFSELRSLDDRVEEGDRIEIYRPLKADPKEARRRRARSVGSE